MLAQSDTQTSILRGKQTNLQRKIDNVVALANQHYEPGNQARSYKVVWRRFVYPVYPICYHTFLSYLNKSGKKIVAPQD